MLSEADHVLLAHCSPSLFRERGERLWKNAVMTIAHGGVTMAHRTETMSMKVNLRSGEILERNFPIAWFEELSFDLKLRLVETKGCLDVYVDKYLRASVPVIGIDKVESLELTFV